MTKATRPFRTNGAIQIAALMCSAITMLGASAAQAVDDSTAWKTLPGGPGTGCATNATPYEFYVHEGDPRRVAIYFQGGGGCWNSRNCGLEGRAVFDSAVNDTDRPWLKAQATGIFDLANPANPLREFTIVMAPYCTADVHLGLGTVRYEAGSDKHLNIHYRGLANAQGVMDWVTRTYTNPKQLFVSGGSAGAIPSPVFASQLARHYASAKVVQLGDGAGAYRSANVAGMLDTWGSTRALKNDPLYRDLDVTTATFELLYTDAAAVKNLQLAQVNSIEDTTQIYFLGELGHKVTKLAPLLSGNLAELRQSNSKLRTYTMPGTMHTILQRPDFYTATVDNVPLSKWVGDLINGRRPANVGDSLLVPAVDRLK